MNCGDDLNGPAKYYLAGDLQCPMPIGESAVTINASNVHLDLRGHRITELSGNSAGIGIGCFDETTVLSDVRISNGIVDGFDFGISACRTTNLQIHRVELINSITGLRLFGVSDGNVSASVFITRTPRCR